MAECFVWLGRLTGENFQKFKKYVDETIFAEYSHKFGLVLENEFFGTSYYKIDFESSLYLKRKFLPADIFDKFKAYLFFCNTPCILPHIDKDVKTVLNIYLEVNEKKTVFWEHVNKINKEGVFDKENLKRICSFAAVSGDIFLLNVKKIHSVESETNNIFYNENRGEKRKVLTFLSDIHFDELQKHFDTRETNYFRESINFFNDL